MSETRGEAAELAAWLKQKHSYFACKELLTTVMRCSCAWSVAAGTLSMGGPGERARARQLLEQAVLLKQQFAGAPDHPGVCSCLFCARG